MPKDLQQGKDVAPDIRLRKGLTLEQVFEPGGLLDRRLPRYEYRPSQLQMAKAVLAAIQEPRHLFVEAGTGTGKTLAYLIPALFSQKRVIVSTATKNLQDQLFFKDIPFIRKHLFPHLAATYMKGRQNYLCLQKMHSHKGQGLLAGGAAEEWDSLTGWAAKTETGDYAELTWIGEDSPFLRILDARSDNCLGQKCTLFAECFVTRMRQRAVESDVIVVNHALFFSNLALQNDEMGRVLPDFSVLILDEAHEVEDIACTHLGRHVSNYQVDDLCRDFRVSMGDCPELLPVVDKLDEKAAEFFSGFPAGEARFTSGQSRFASGMIAALVPELQNRHEALLGACSALYHSLFRQSQRPSEADSLLRRLESLRENLTRVFEEEKEEEVRWFERRGRGVYLHMNPIDVAAVLKDSLFAKTDAAVLTSATLTASGSFDYIRERLGVAEAMEVRLPGEFDYATQTILYVPKEFPEPGSAQYFLRTLREIREILEITEGHAFLLFTSFYQMERVYKSLHGAIQYPVLKQGSMPKGKLLDLFKETPHAVLCATASFWQGVDVQGDALRAVIIDKLPFSVPTEPVVAARVKRLTKEGENAFLRYTVPEAIIALKQGLGRLIRSRDDRGILAVFDSRIRTRRYGELFLQSLPKCPVTDNMMALRNFFSCR
jgi:ATP-dependent DNA helicase DinG